MIGVPHTQDRPIVLLQTVCSDYCHLNQNRNNQCNSNTMNRWVSTIYVACYARAVSDDTKIKI